jgi:exopolysaccharide production protein ExoZ
VTRASERLPAALGGSPPPRRPYLHGLDLLRVVASVLVVYTHVSNWFSTRGHESWLMGFLNGSVVEPFQLNPGMSFAGVSIFLLVSGIVVTYVGERETSRQFLRRRLARILPLLAVVTIVAWVLINLGLYLSETRQESLDLLDLLKGITLAGFFTTPEVVLLGVAWTLVNQIFFYAYASVTLPLLRRRAWVPSALAAALVCVGLSLTAGVQDVGVHRLGMVAAYFPVMCIGHVVSLVTTRKISALTGTALGAVHFLLFVWADKLGGYLDTGTAHPRTLLLTVGLVVLCMHIGGRVSRAPVVKNWSSRTYAIYLLHPLCIYPIMDWLVPYLGTAASLLIALALLAVTTELCHRYVEMPANRWFRNREKPTMTASG